MNANTMSPWSPLLVLVILVAGQQHLANAVQMIPCAKQVDLFRLPTHVLPRHYNLDIKLESDWIQFSGKVDISLEIIRKRLWEKTHIGQTVRGMRHPFATNPRMIILNIDGLVVTDAQFQQGEKLMEPQWICNDQNYKILVVALNILPHPGEATLHLEFNGKLATDYKGPFRNFLEPTSTIVATHSKPNHARRLFPCFDEPEFKASFQLIIRSAGQTRAVSNMKPIQRVIGLDGSFAGFEITPVMSPYLLSFAVGTFDMIEESSVHGAEFVLHAAKNCAENGRTMLRKAVEAYEKVVEFFQPQQQQPERIYIVPVESEPIPLENWGLITMESDLLFADPTRSSPNDWMRAVIVMVKKMIYHVIANLVTMRWWDNRWLMEGLVAYLANELIAQMHPEFNNELYTLVDTIFSAMDEDDRTPRSINVKDIEGKDRVTAYDFERSFDLNAYRKSVALVRMFGAYFPEEKFLKAIKNLTRLKTGHGIIDDEVWWRLIAKKTEHNTQYCDMGRQWASQVGYPTIVVDLQENEGLTVRQVPELANDQTWAIPIKYAIHTKIRRKHDDNLYLNKLQAFIPFPHQFIIEHSLHWISLNPKYHGYYRVIYLSDLLLTRRSQAMIHSLMTAAERMQVLSDYFSDFKRRRSLNRLEQFLQFVLNFGEKNDGVVLLWTRILTQLDDNQSPLARSEEVKSLMVSYYDQSDGCSEEAPNLLKLYTRELVADYLVTRFHL